MTPTQPDSPAKPPPGAAGKQSEADRKVDEAVKETFPASDPPSTGGIAGPTGDTKR